MREPFIDPQQIALHRLLVVGRDQPGGASILAVPGMDELMRKKIGLKIMRIWIAEYILAGAVVAGFVMLQPVVRGLIAQRPKEGIFFIVSRSEQLTCFGHQLVVA